MQCFCYSERVFGLLHNRIDIISHLAQAESAEIDEDQYERGVRWRISLGVGHRSF